MTAKMRVARVCMAFVTLSQLAIAVSWLQFCLLQAPGILYLSKPFVGPFSTEKIKTNNEQFENIATSRANGL